MALVKLKRVETKRSLLPDVCVVSGEPTEETKTHQFLWTPPWTYLIILVGLLPYVIVALILRKSMTVQLPVSPACRGHWWKRKTVIVLGLLGSIGLGIVGVVMLNDQPNARGNSSNLSGFACGGSVIFFLLWIIVSIFLNLSMVRPKEITDDSITLVNVHQNFVDALEEMRAKDWEEEQRYREERRRKRAEQEQASNDDGRPRPRARRVEDDDE